ncbi:MAG: hypothetical protein KKA73_10350 [Chloroflexi bacterium]|nr:hypothetical protein [Chloroflexota bacterium]MBU1748078.1 hypothetical protein [Chloroflexota bacterium]
MTVPTDRREPWLVAALPCRAAYASADGYFLTEVDWGLVADRYPARRLGPLRLYTRWAGGVGEFTLTTRILDPAGLLVPALDGLGQEATSRLVLQPAPDPAQPGGCATAIHEFAELVFPVPGCYWIHVILDDVLVVRVPFWAVATAQPLAAGVTPAAYQS